MERMMEFAQNHWIMFSILGVLIYLLVQDLIESLTRNYGALSPIGAVDLMNNQDIAIVDVREPAEFVTSHIENAINIPSSKFDKRFEELKPFKDGPVLVSCQSGTHSPKACSKLVKEGFQNVYLLKGGIQAWQDLNLPIRRSKPKHRGGGA